MCTKSELDEILKLIAGEYKKTYGEKVEKILLYGSYARGDNGFGSDIDIVAIVDDEREQLQQNLKKIWDVAENLELEYDTLISPSVIPAAEYEKYKAVLPYYGNIEREGIVVDG